MLLRKQFTVFAAKAHFSTAAKAAAPSKVGEFYQNMIYRGRDVSIPYLFVTYIYRVSYHLFLCYLMTRMNFVV